MGVHRNTADVIAAGVGALLRQHRHLEQREAGPDLPSYTLGLLAAVQRCSPVRLGDLAVRSGVDPSVISRQVAALEAADLVQREADPVDRRACRLRMTEHGSDVLTGLLDRRRAFLEAAIADWTEADALVLQALLTRLTDDIDRASTRHLTATTGGRP